jgi:DNA (cytosine-5)-methyltransferase 1
MGKRRAKLKFVDLFAGTGGMRLGLERACQALGRKFECVFSSEIDPNSCESYALNFGENPSCDITEVEDLPKHDLMLAGFPCQSFSYAGKQKGFGDTRGTLFFHVHRLLESSRPKAFLLENVRGLTTHDKGRTFRTIVDRLQDLGYSLHYARLNSCNFGVPQNRVRIYILGLLNKQIDSNIVDDVGAPDSHAFKARSEQLTLFGENKPLLVKDILESKPGKKYRCSDAFIGMLKGAAGSNLSKLHGYRLIDYRNGNSLHSWELGIKGKCTKAEIGFMNALIANRRKKHFGREQDGKKLTKKQILTFYNKGDFERVTASLIEKGYLQVANGRYNPVCGNMSFEVFKFLDPESISITLTASDTNRLGVVARCVPRKITPREAARLQGFPDSYRLVKNDNAVYKQMGNAVSVPVVQSVLHDFLTHNSV